MPKRSSKKEKSPKRVEDEDVNELAARIVDSATEEESEEPLAPANGTSGKNPAAVALGRLGGLKGGHARAAKLTAEERSEIARNAAKARWKQESE